MKSLDWAVDAPAMRVVPAWEGVSFGRLTFRIGESRSDYSSARPFVTASGDVEDSRVTRRWLDLIAIRDWKARSGLVLHCAGRG